MSDIIKEVRVRESVYQNRDIKVIIEKSGLLNKKRKVYGIPWGKKEETWSTWEPIEFTINDLTEDKNFGDYSKFYAEYIKERDQPNNIFGLKVLNFHERNNLEFSSEWNSDLDIIKLYILINTEKYKENVYEWNLIEDPIVGEKGGTAPYYRSFGVDHYYLNNGVQILINWDYSLGEKWSDDKGNELDNTNPKFYHDKKIIYKSDITKVVYGLYIPDDVVDTNLTGKFIYYKYDMIYTNKEGKYISSFSPSRDDVNVSKASLRGNNNYGGYVNDTHILNEIIKKWKENVPGYENLDIVKSIHGTPVISLSDAVDYKRIEYKSPFGTEIGLSASGPSASGPSASGPSASGASASEPISTGFKLTFDGIQDGFQITAKTDLPSFSIYVGDPKKDWPVVGAGDLPQDGEDFENVEGAPQEGIDEEYTEESFMGAEESELQFNDTIIVSPTDEKEDSGSYLDKGGAGSEQIGPIEPGLPANEAQKESAKKSRVATGCMSSGGGACARYTWNLAKNYHRFLKGLTGLPQREAAGGNAKQAAYYNRLVEELKYKKIENKSSVTKDDLIKSIKDTKWGIGDVICYWSNGSGGESHQIYGHTQMYVGAISAGGWASDQVDNFSCSMVYKSKTDNNWGYVAFRSPDTPSNS